MTTSQRLARAAATSDVSIGEFDVMRVLRDPDAPVWHDSGMYRVVMARARMVVAGGGSGGRWHSRGQLAQLCGRCVGRRNCIEDFPEHANWHQPRAMRLIASPTTDARNPNRPAPAMARGHPATRHAPPAALGGVFLRLIMRDWRTRSVKGSGPHGLLRTFCNFARNHSSCLPV